MDITDNKVCDRDSVGLIVRKRHELLALPGIEDHRWWRIKLSQQLFRVAFERIVEVEDERDDLYPTPIRIRCFNDASLVSAPVRTPGLLEELGHRVLVHAADYKISPGMCTPVCPIAVGSVLTQGTTALGIMTEAMEGS